MAGSRELGIHHAWATTFYQRDWPEHAAEAPAIIARLYERRAADSAAIASGVAPNAKAGLYESDFDLFADNHPGLRKLADFCRETLQVAVAHVNGGEFAPHQLRVDLFESWCHITGDGGYHDAHVHPSCSWCGIYYLRIGSSSQNPGGAPNGGSRFYSPLQLGGRYQDYGNKYLNVTSIDAPIRDGLLTLFPSYLLHSGLPYRGTVERVVIAFNARIQVADVSRTDA